MKLKGGRPRNEQHEIEYAFRNSNGHINPHIHTFCLIYVTNKHSSIGFPYNF